MGTPSQEKQKWVKGILSSWSIFAATWVTYKAKFWRAFCANEENLELTHLVCYILLTIIFHLLRGERLNGHQSIIKIKTIECQLINQMLIRVLIVTFVNKFLTSKFFISFFFISLTHKDWMITYNRN